MTIGCLMLDLEGTALSQEEVEILQHPLTGGIILFSRNFESQAQVQELCLQIKKNARKPFLLAVDQEGGRVQRFHNDFTAIPAMGSFKQLQLSESTILEKLTATGWIMAAELIASGVDISFAPVLDIDTGISKVIGDRGFSDQPEQIIKYSAAFIKGMKSAGMSATGKHFPGHGSTVADSHYELPVDERSLSEIYELDLSVFKTLCEQGLTAIMPAHVIYPEVDSLPACFSNYWLKTVLRDELNFQGTVFSDDLSMAGAKIMGDILSRAREALSAGCDMVLCCNDRQAAMTLLDQLNQQQNTEKSDRIKKMIAAKSRYSFDALKLHPAWQKTKLMLQQIES